MCSYHPILRHSPPPPPLLLYLKQFNCQKQRCGKSFLKIFFDQPGINVCVCVMECNCALCSEIVRYAGQLCTIQYAPARARTLADSHLAADITVESCICIVLQSMIKCANCTQLVKIL